MFDNLWVEKYRPKKLDDFCISETSGFKTFLKKCKDNNEIPNLLLVGNPGIGKTTIAKIIVNELLECDHLYINASDENGIDTIRSKVTSYARTKSLYDIKIIILDECDGLTQDGQRALRNVMEEYSAITRFILTANYKHRIIPALQSRCQTFDINHDKTPIVSRLVHIGEKEKVSCKLSDVQKVVEENFPDIRKTINVFQKNVTDGNLTLQDEASVDKICQDLFKLVRAGHVLKCRKYMITNEHIFNNDYPNLLKNLFNVIDESDLKESDKKVSLTTVYDFMYKSAFVMDQEINAYACLVELSNCSGT
jgi:DNA polymerase III delta prime subunit